MRAAINWMRDWRLLSTVGTANTRCRWCGRASRRRVRLERRLAGGRGDRIKVVDMTVERPHGQARVTSERPNPSIRSNRCRGLSSAGVLRAELHPVVWLAERARHHGSYYGSARSGDADAPKGSETVSCRSCPRG